MSLIPKINLGVGTKRSKANLSFDSQTTANIGFVQPTMARMLIPNSSINVKNRTLVRMSPLVNPTFGRLSQRDYFTFVRMSDVYKPWAEFLSGKPYSFGSTTYTPTELPRFSMAKIVGWLLANNCYYSFSPAADVNINVGWNENYTDDTFNALMLKLKNFVNTFAFAGYHPVLADTDTLDDPFGASSIITQGREGILEYFTDTTLDNDFGVRKANGVEVVNNENADFTIFIPGSYFDNSTAFWYTYPGDDAKTIFTIGSTGVYLHIRLKPFAKNMRKIFIGCGYGFDYWDNEYYTPFKLFAFFKSWFDTFKPLRNSQFTNTYCYQLIKRLEDTISVANLNDAIIQWLQRELVSSFYYYTAPDYFSAALYNLGDNTLVNTQNNSVVSPIVGDITSYRTLAVDSSLVENAKVPTSDGLDSLGSVDSTVNPTVYRTLGVNAVNGSTTIPSERLDSKYQIDKYFNLNAIAIPTLLKLMRFTNKNNVIGRSIREYAKVHYGIDDIQSDNMSVTKINATRTDINFDDVMNTAASKDAFLGEYAGKGLGYKESENTYFTAKDFGFFFCMSVIVPESGYYQGTLKENKISDKFEFFTPEFDALGYEVISRGEIKNDFTKNSSDFDPSTAFQTDLGFGFIPRYTHFKVGRNIVNGDLTLGSTKNGLQGYYLDKEFPSYKTIAYGRRQFKNIAPDYLPLVVNDNIRKIDPTDNVGNYNRIFQYTDIDFDHFIIQKVFDVEVTAPWKSISDSFDTIQQDENVISRNHQ